MSEPQRTTESIIKNDRIFYCVIKAQAFEHFLIAVSCTVKEELASFLESIRYAPHVTNRKFRNLESVEEMD
jgi:hypothetical protein